MKNSASLCNNVYFLDFNRKTTKILIKKLRPLTFTYILTLSLSCVRVIQNRLRLFTWECRKRHKQKYGLDTDNGKDEGF